MLALQVFLIDHQAGFQPLWVKGLRLSFDRMVAQSQLKIMQTGWPVLKYIQESCVARQSQCSLILQLNDTNK